MSSPLSQFQRRKRQAHWLLLLAALLFILTLTSGKWAITYGVSPYLIRGLQAISEAAMVGGLADWFAVSALFRRIPIPVIGQHSNILVENQDRIATNLAQFVHTHFFNPQALTNLLQRYDLPQMVGLWLRKKSNRQTLAKHAQVALAGAIRSWDDAAIQGFIKTSLQNLINKTDFRPAVQKIIRLLVDENRHQEVLDQIITALAKYLSKEESHQHIAESLANWIREEYPKASLLLPTETIGNKGADLIKSFIANFFRDVYQDEQHFVRLSLDDYIQNIARNITHDEVWQNRLLSAQQYITSNPELQHYAFGIWKDVRNWLMADLQSDASRIKKYFNIAGIWLSQSLLNNEALRASLQDRVMAVAQYSGPYLGDFVQTHIESTLASFDSQRLVTEIEQQVGADLQSIRINGTVLGGVIGALLYLFSLIFHL